MNDQELKLESKYKKVFQLLARTWIWVIWVWVCIFAFISIDRHLGGPFFGLRTALGRTERLAYAPAFIPVVVGCAVWLSARRYHTRRRLLVFGLISFAVGLVDAYFLMSAIFSTALIFGYCSQFGAAATLIHGDE